MSKFSSRVLGDVSKSLTLGCHGSGARTKEELDAYLAAAFLLTGVGRDKYDTARMLVVTLCDQRFGVPYHAPLVCSLDVCAHNSYNRDAGGRHNSPS